MLGSYTGEISNNNNKLQFAMATWRVHATEYMEGW